MSDSIFIQLGSISEAELRDALAWAHKTQRYTDLAVSQVGDNGEGYLYEKKLAILDPYLPWGERKTFNNVFFGTNVNYEGVRDPYGQAMKSADFRWKQLLLQRRIASRIKQRYPHRPIHFYVEHEAPLNYLADPSLNAAYEAFLVQSVRDLRHVQPGCAILWSPAFWTPSIPSGLDLPAFFRRVQQFSDGTGIDWLHLQDMQGRDRPDINEQHAVAWFEALPNFRSKRMNMELFRTENGQMYPEAREVIDARKSFYRSRGVPIGISWELRWDYRAPDAAERPFIAPQTDANEIRDLDSLYQVAEDYRGARWPRLAAHNTWASRRQQVADWLKDGVHRGSYSRRAELAEHVGKRIRRITGLEVQGIRYMRPYTPNPSTGRAVNSDHLTAGALDIMIYNDEDAIWLPALYRMLERLEERHVVRYIIKKDQNAAHHNHIHVSFQIGAQV